MGLQQEDPTISVHSKCQCFIHTDNAVVQSGLMQDATDACLAHCNGVGNACALLQALLIGIDTMGTASIAVLCNSAGSNKTLWYKQASGLL